MVGHSVKLDRNEGRCEIVMSSTESATDVLEEVRTQRPWNVVVWNDPVTPMTVVVLIFRKVFNYSTSRATKLMLEVHHQGRSIVWSGERERAQGYCVTLQSHGLLCSIEQAS